MCDGRLKLIVTADGPAYVPEKEFSLISLTYSSIETTVSDRSVDGSGEEFTFKRESIDDTDEAYDEAENEMLTQAVNKILEQITTSSYFSLDVSIFTPSKKEAERAYDGSIQRQFQKLAGKRFPLLQVCFWAPKSPLLQETIDYDCLVFRARDLSYAHKLTDKMLESKFLRICAKLEDPSQLEGFKGWGLQFMAVKLNGMGLELIEQEAKKWQKGDESHRKITTLSYPPFCKPESFEEDDLNRILSQLKKQRLEISKGGRNQIYRYTHRNGSTAGIVFTGGDLTHISFIRPYEDILVDLAIQEDPYFNHRL